MVFIVGINKVSGMYRVLLVRKDEETKQQKYGIADMTEQMIMYRMNQGLKFQNAGLQGNKIVGTTGSLERFITQDARKPLVIISELIDKSKNTIGYRVSDCNGAIKSISALSLIEYADKMKKEHLVAIQNGVYIEKTNDAKAHIRSFKQDGYNREILLSDENVNKYKTKTNYSENKKSMSRLEEIFNKKQIEQLKIGREHGVNIILYANKEFSAEQMQVIREGLELKVKVKLYLDPKFSVLQMRRLKVEMAAGYDVSAYANPAYSIAQMAQIKLGMISKVDISKFANTKTSAEEMSEIRMRLEDGIWCDCEASKIDSSII